MQHNDLAAEHLQLLVELAVGNQDAEDRNRTISRILLTEAMERGGRLRMVEMIRTLALDEPSSWCLRYAAGRAVAAALDPGITREFTPADLAVALDDHIDAPLLTYTAATTGDAALARGGIVTAERTSAWSGWASLQLAAGFELWFLGLDPVACEAASPLVVPGWAANLPPVMDAGSRLAAYLERHESTSLVLLCHDQVFAAAVAAQASLARQRQTNCWLCPYPTDAASDPFPQLVWANNAAGRDTVLVAATDDSIYDVPSLREAWTGLDLRRHPSTSTVYVVQRTLDPDPLDLRSTLQVLDLEPLWIGQAAPAIHRTLESAAQRDLDAPLDGQILRSVNTRNADIGIRMMALHREVLGDVAAKAIPDLVNRESRISASMALGNGDDEETDTEPEIPDTTLDHLVLDDATRTVFDNIIQRAQAGKRCVVVAYGPPGVGKSLSARCLAGSLERPVAAARASDLRGKYYGQEERCLQQLFEQAEQHDEVLVFDEADEWVGRREGSSAGESGSRIMESSEMLLNLERFTGVAVLTTNRVEVLDPALHRRVDVWLSLKIPGPDERMALWARVLDEQIKIDSALLVTLSSVPLSGGDIEACVAQVDATTREMSAQSLMDAARERAEMRTLLG